MKFVGFVLSFTWDSVLVVFFFFKIKIGLVRNSKIEKGCVKTCVADYVPDSYTNECCYRDKCNRSTSIFKLKFLFILFNILSANLLIKMFN